MNRKWWLIGLVFTLLLGFAMLRTRHTFNSTLKASFLSQTNVARTWIARVTVTNGGNLGPITFKGCRVDQIDFKGTWISIDLGGTAKIRHLQPGEGHVVEVAMEPAFSGARRVTCFYSRDGLRSRIYDWMGAARGAAPLNDWFLLASPKKIPIDVRATTKWFEE